MTVYLFGISITTKHFDTNNTFIDDHSHDHDCSVDFPQKTLLATFSTLAEAEEYVTACAFVEKTSKVNGKTVSRLYPRLAFQKLGLLQGYDDQEILEVPHNPKLPVD